MARANRHGELDGLVRDDAVGWVRELDQNPVRSGLEADHDEGLAGGVDEVPRRVVDGDVDVPDARRDVARGGAAAGAAAPGGTG